MKSTVLMYVKFYIGSSDELRRLSFIPTAYMTGHNWVWTGMGTEYGGRDWEVWLGTN